MRRPLHPHRPYVVPRQRIERGSTAHGAISRARSVLLGLAVGDALGGPLEFLSATEIRTRFDGPLTDYIGGGWLSLEPGHSTDDTGLARLWPGRPRPGWAPLLSQPRTGKRVIDRIDLKLVDGREQRRHAPRPASSRNAGAFALSPRTERARRPSPAAHPAAPTRRRPTA